MSKKALAWLLSVTIILSGLSGCTWIIKKNREEKEAVERVEKQEQISENIDKEKKEQKEEANKTKSADKSNRQVKGPKKFGVHEVGSDQQRNKPESPVKQGDIDGYTAYRDILTHMVRIMESDGAEGNYDPGEVGIMEELPRVLEQNGSAVEAFGYIIEDLSGDGVPELVIGDRRQDEFVTEGNKIYALYTLVGNTPELVFEGGTGYDYYLTENRNVFEIGGYTRMHPYFGLFKMSKDAINREYLDFYFTVEKEALGKLGFYHNHKGIADPEISKEIKHDVEEEGIGEYMKDIRKTVVRVPFYPFSAYEVSEGRTYTVWGRFMEEADEFTNHHYFEADTTESQVSIVFFANRTVKNFKILNIEANLDEKTSEMKYKTREIYSVQELNMRTPFVLKMTFYGLYPTKGFSYEEDGIEKGYTIEMSNKDGSLYFIKF